MEDQKKKTLGRVFSGVKSGFYDYIEFILQRHTIEKCEKILESINVGVSALWGILGGIGVVCSHWILILSAVLLGAFHLAVWFSFHNVINKRTQIRQNEIEKLKADYVTLSEQHQEIMIQYSYNLIYLSEMILLAKRISAVQKDRKPKSLYICLANSICQMIIEYSKLRLDQFSVSIYMYDGNSSLLQRVEVATTVSNIQAPRTSHALSIEKKKDYFYAKSILSSKRTFILCNSKAFESAFFFEEEDKAVLNHYSQYAAMTYSLGSKIKMYVEVIAYDDAKLGDDLDGFIEKTIAPFSSQIALIDWYKMKGGIS